MKGNERWVEEIFAAWLARKGWTVERQVDFIDILAKRGNEELRAEVKGASEENGGTDADIAYGQLLRRMEQREGLRYGLVGPTSAMKSYRRVPAFVRKALRISMYEVTDSGEVILHGD